MRHVQLCVVLSVVAAAVPADMQAGPAGLSPAPQDSCNAAAVITGDGLGGLRIGETVSELRRSCTVVRDYEETGEEGLPAHFVQVDFGSDTVTAELDAGRIWRIRMESPAFATKAGIRVGTPISRLLASLRLEGAEGEGSLFVFSPDDCGLSFRVRYRIPEREYRAHWTRDDLAVVPGDAPVDLILIVGCRKGGAEGHRGPDAPGATVAADTFRYEPSVTTVSGVLEVRQEYGPPNFGETPDQDERLEIPILKLDHPVVVSGDPSSALNLDTFPNVTELQLVGVPDRAIRGLDGRRVVVQGRLFEKESGYHFTDVLIAARAIDGRRVPDSVSPDAGSIAVLPLSKLRSQWRDMAACDLQDTAGLTPSWSLTRDLAAKIDPVVRSQLADALGHSSGVQPRAADYLLQYAGVSYAGRRAILVNGFHRDLARLRDGAGRRNPMGAAIRENWREEPIFVCDAGRLQFTMVVDSIGAPERPLRFFQPL